MDSKILDDYIKKTNNELTQRRSNLQEANRRLAEVKIMKGNTARKNTDLVATQKELQQFISQQQKSEKTLVSLRDILREKKRLTNIQRAVYKRDTLLDRILGRSYQVKMPSSRRKNK